MDDKKKKFIPPEVEVIDFTDEDIITLSGAGAGNSNWNSDDNNEPWAW